MSYVYCWSCFKFFHNMQDTWFRRNFSVNRNSITVTHVFLELGGSTCASIVSSGITGMFTTMPR